MYNNKKYQQVTFSKDQLDKEYNKKIFLLYQQYNRALQQKANQRIAKQNLTKNFLRRQMQLLRKKNSKTRMLTWLSERRAQEEKNNQVYLKPLPDQPYIPKISTPPPKRPMMRIK